MGYQDFTRYTEYDLSSHIELAENVCTFTNLSGGEDAYAYRDKGIGYYNGDINHEIQIKLTDSSGDAYARAGVWMLANLINDFQGIDSASGDFHLVFFYFDGSNVYIYLRECDGGTLYSDTYQCSLNTDYYCRVVRDESIGTYGTLYLYIYSDSDKTQLLDVLAVSLHSSKKDFRYLYPVCSSNNGAGGRIMSGIVSYFDTNDSVANALDYTEFTEVDPNGRYEVYEDEIIVKGLTGDEAAYVYKDFGGGYFDTDAELEHLIHTKTTGGLGNSIHGMLWALANALGDFKTLQTAAESYLNCCWIGSGEYIYIREGIGGALYQDFATVTTNDTNYYIKIRIDPNVGTYGTMYAFIYSDKERLTLIDSLSISLHQSIGYRYLYGFGSRDNNSSDTGSFVVSGLILQEDLIEYENFATYIESDSGNNIFTLPNRVYSNGIGRDDTCYLYKDFGAAYFDSDFLHSFDVRISEAFVGSGGPMYSPWALSNTAAKDIGTQFNDGDPYLALLVISPSSGVYYLRLMESFDSVTYYLSTFTCEIGTRYYVEIRRDESVGTYGELAMLIYEDSSRRNLIDVISMRLHSSKQDFRYLYAMSASYSGIGNSAYGDMQFMKLSPTYTVDSDEEDFRTFTESDGNFKVQVTPNNIGLEGFVNTDGSLVYSDKGLNHFEENFEHLAESYVTYQNGSGANIYFWALANTINNVAVMDASSEYIIGVYTHFDGSSLRSIRVIEWHNSSYYLDYFGSMELDRRYWITIVRDETIGTYGTLFAYIYQDEYRGILLDTISIALHQKVDLRYLYALNTYANGGAITTGTYGHINIQEETIITLFPQGLLIDGRMYTRGLLIGGRL